MVESQVTMIFLPSKQAFFDFFVTVPSKFQTSMKYPSWSSMYADCQCRINPVTWLVLKSGTGNDKNRANYHAPLSLSKFTGTKV